MFFRNGENNITSPVTVIEFKRPKRTNYSKGENPIMQALRYSRTILEGRYEMPDGIEPVKVSKQNTPVYVYTTSGILVKSFRLASEEVRLELQNGVYLVKMNGHITKTTIK